MTGPVFFLIMAVLTLAFLFNLVRSRRLREKYVALWMLVGLVIIVLALFPDLLGWLAGLAGIAVPSNLLFGLAILLLLAVCLQLSLEISRAEEKTRTLAEHVAILDLQVYELTNRLPATTDPSAVLRSRPGVPPAESPADTAEQSR